MRILLSMHHSAQNLKYTDSKYIDKMLAIL